MISVIRIYFVFIQLLNQHVYITWRLVYSFLNWLQRGDFVYVS